MLLYGTNESRYHITVGRQDQSDGYGYFSTAGKTLLFLTCPRPIPLVNTQAELRKNLQSGN